MELTQSHFTLTINLLMYMNTAQRIALPNQTQVNHRSLDLKQFQALQIMLKIPAITRTGKAGRGTISNFISTFSSCKLGQAVAQSNMWGLLEMYGPYH